ncbi:zinc-finger double domain-containing protein [Phthorimaea operculella]|nr:zinc-finger double domain-containing protein [Phthorimaea operculella]
MVCRICLGKGAVRSIFKKRQSLSISAKIMSLARVQIYPDDGLPSTICKKCVKQLDQCTDFIHLCEESDAKLRASLTLSDTVIFKSEIPVECSPNHETDSTDHYPDDNTDNFPIQNTVSLKSELDTTNGYSKTNKEMEIEISTANTVEETAKIEKKSKTKPYQCTICGKILSAGSSLQTHLRTHSGERPYSCTHCPKTFTLKTTLNFHLRIHTGEKPLKCPECNVSFRHPSSLRTHQRIHSGETPYKCVLCPKSFHTASNLRYHVRKHTGEKNFECDSCGKAFISRGHLKQHMLQHSGERRFMCFVCGSRLSRASHLRRHMQNVHNKQPTDKHTAEDGNEKDTEPDANEKRDHVKLKQSP